MGPRPTIKNPGKLFKRLMAYILKGYTPHCIIAVVCIAASVFASTQGTMFMRTLIDSYIEPMLGALASGKEAPDFSPLAGAIIKMACIYAGGVFAAFIQARIMVVITQGVMMKLRNDMFEKMESLPIKYFDTHAHGDIMSMYTNDVDTLRQMVSQSIPQLINSAITVVTVLSYMFILSVPLTLVTLAMVTIMMVSAKKVGGLSSRFFLSQQIDIGAVNGYVEEMMNGQKVVKVFCHEDEAAEKFNELNDRLFDSAYHANLFANIMGPINAQLGNLSYVVCTVAGGMLALTGISGLTLGSLASFLNFNRSFNMPVNQPQ